ncbi:MAG: helix-turn-helix transcriptional regulator [Oscillospiraceae bacterium]|nr:helix-turn-helix transcriptional regulator [Oscillospiraceae bacterium]
MMLKINQNAYPFIEQVKKLPVYLTGIGGTEYQGNVKRTEGYCWHQILFCADGSGRFIYNNTETDITANCFIFIPAFCPHEYIPNNEKWDMRWVVFDGCSCEDILREFGLEKPMIIRTDSISAMQKLYDKMFVTLKTDKIYGNYICSGLVYQYILEFHRLALDNSEKNKADKSDILMPALNYIEENYTHDFPIAALADVSGVSQQYLCRIFNQTMNIRPNEYITCRRLQEAKLLLTETNIPVKEICTMSGFSDAGYFSTVFRKYEKISPIEYRRRYAGIAK